MFADLILSRTLTALTLIQSLLFYSRQISGYYIIFAPRHIFKFPPEIWRLCTSFMLTGKELEFFFDLYNSRIVSAQVHDYANPR